MAEREKVEIEVALRDIATRAITQATKDLQAFYERARAGDIVITSGSLALNRNLVEIDGTARRAGSSLNDISAQMTLIGAMMGGVAGVAVSAGSAVSGLASMLAKFSSEKLGLKSFSRDTGLSFEEVKKIQIAFQEIGETEQQADSAMARAASKLQSMLPEQRGSAMFHGLTAGGQTPELATSVLAKMNQGKTMEAISLIVERHRSLKNDDGKKYWEDQLGLSRSEMEALQKENLARIKVSVPTPEEMEALEKFNKTKVHVQENYLKAMKDALGNKALEAVEGIRDSDQKVYGVGAAQIVAAVPIFGPAIGAAALLGKYAITPKHEQREIDQEQRKSVGFLTDISGTLARIWDDISGDKKPDEKQQQPRGRGKLAEHLGMRRESGGGGGRASAGNVEGMVGGEKTSTGLFYPVTSTKLGGVVGSDSASMGKGRHAGDDFMAAHGSPLYATKDGTVEKLGVDNWGGATMRVRHPDGSTTSYLHMARRDLDVGAKVTGGQIIGTSGTANGVPHLHIEMRDPSGRLIEPSEALGVQKRARPEPVRAGVGSGATEIFKKLRDRFKGSALDGYTPADGAEYGITTGSADQWARLATAVGMQESDLNPNIKNGMFQFGPEDLARRGIDPRRVHDPDAQLDAVVKQFETDIPKTGYIAGRDENGRWRGGARYFEPLQRPWQLDKRWGAANKVAAEVGMSDIDSAMKRQPAAPRIRAKVNFKNAPAWLKTAVDTDGVDTMTVERNNNTGGDE